MPEPCYAPVFERASFLTCLIRAISYAFVVLALLLLILITLGNERFICQLKQTIFRMKHCRDGNSDPRIDLNMDAYEWRVHDYRERFGKSEEWEQWMLDNRDRYIHAFDIARARPDTLTIAFRYDTTPIAYNPPWTSEAEHMGKLEEAAEGCYAGYDIDFVFNGDTTSSYCNVVAGIPTNDSHASGKTVYLYYEGIFNHEFGHIMGLWHHYDSDAETGMGMHMPPGETLCLMDRRGNQLCSACRTALDIPLNVDNDAAIDAAIHNINSRYPY